MMRHLYTTPIMKQTILQAKMRIVMKKKRKTKKKFMKVLPQWSENTGGKMPCHLHKNRNTEVTTPRATKKTGKIT